MKTISNTLGPKLLRKNGYFLIELLISAVILTAGILFILDSMRVPVVVARRSLCTLQALSLGSTICDRIIHDKGTCSVYEAGEQRIGNTVYSWEVSERKSLDVAGLSNKIKLLTVEVRWERDSEHRIELPVLCRNEEEH